ncbi:MAG TPA: FAD-dependent oxidoreductase [Candidatus Rubneribacter avistercoris]|nr:FAD-dependent oxidoreductase [Candidatus Rubneribacter avistercoris]
MERRSFFKLAGVSAASLAAGGALGACALDQVTDALPSSTDASGTEAEATVVGQPPVSFSTSVDVLVVGSGIAGLSAAMAPAEAGLSVMVAEKLSLLGGESYSSNGIMHVAGSKLQQAAGIAQTAEEAWPARKKQLSNAGASDLEFAKRLYLAAPTWIDRMEGVYGAQFCDPSQYAREGVNDAILLPKNGLGDMESVMVPLRDALAGKGVAFQTGYRAVAFVLDEQAAVCGVRFLAQESGDVIDVRARRVVVATGGFASNQALVDENAPTWLRVGCYTYASMGEGHELCRRAGGQLSGMDLALPLIGDLPPVSAWGMFAPTLVVDAQGHRFAREDDVNAAADACFGDERGFWWTVFDERLSEGSQSRSAAQIASKNARRMVGPCESVEDLADAIGVSPEVLRATFDRYGQMAEAGKDDDFGREANLEALEAPYYAVKQLPVRYRTRGGAATDEDGRLIGTSGATILNVCCCGAVAADGGEGLASSGTFGMLVGQAVVDALSSSEG